MKKLPKLADMDGKEVIITAIKDGKVIAAHQAVLRTKGWRITYGSIADDKSKDK